MNTPHTDPECAPDQSGPLPRSGEGGADRDPDLAGLTVLYGLSIRAFNVCRAGQLDRLSTIREFHKRHGGFAKLRNCGLKTAKELESLLVIDRNVRDFSSGKVEELLSDEQIHRIYMAAYSELDLHSHNALVALIGPPVAITGINLFMRFGDELQDLPGVSGPILKELRHMRRVLFKNLDRQRHALRVAQLKSTAVSMEQWSQAHALSKESLAMLFGPDGDMRLLRFMDHYLEHFDNRNSYRLLLFHLHQPGDGFTMPELAEHFDLTKERVRQVLSTAEARLRKPFEVIADLPEVQTHYPELVTEGPVFLITRELIDRLNTRDGTCFAAEAILYIAHAVDPQGLVIGSWSDLFGPAKLSSELEHQQHFLIDPLIVGPVKRMTAELTARLRQKRKEMERMDTALFLNTVEPGFRSRALSVFKDLIPLRFQGVVAGEDHFMLPPNTMKFNDDRLVEVLESLNEPSHVNAIMAEWQRRFPAREITIDAIRNLVVHGKDVFTTLGRTSTYALRRWEIERGVLSSGSIRELVAEALRATDLPLSPEELERAIQIKRPRTSASAIIHNLKLDKSDMFSFHPGGYVGLASKTYPYIPPPTGSVPGHLFQEGALTRFLGRHRNDLADHLASQCAASPLRIERVIDKAIEEGRLYTDDSGIIRGTRSSNRGTENGTE